MSDEEFRQRVQSCLRKFRGFLKADRFPTFDVGSVVPIDDFWHLDCYFPGAENGARNAGIYFILDEARRIIYIGKASANSSIGARLATYFEDNGEANRPWRISTAGEKLKTYSPDAVAVITFSDYSFSWIVPALEEFLIKELKPVANTLGTNF